MRYAASKLHKVGEYGYGPAVLCIYSGDNYNYDVFLPAINLNKSKKIHCYYLDLKRDRKLRNEALIELLNKFYFVSCILLDFPTFISICDNFLRIKLFQIGFKNIIIFNPVKIRPSIIEGFLSYKYVNLNNQIVKLKSKNLGMIYNFYKNVPEIRAEKLDIISLQDLSAAIKLATFVKNSKVFNAKNYNEALNLLNKIL